MDNFDRTKIYGEVITSMFFKENIHFLKKIIGITVSYLLKKEKECWIHCEQQKGGYSFQMVRYLEF
jgi:hypothetical protein